ncbi:retrovirus-related Pol polyprotein from type-1 retrotransposable element R2 [Caerostris darwini]|uniref:Retrovirus-related Pol polyprotein from type-1 retrotransposable element R2 n=1 Tax=Caerostris darwini TaxID=1538125 RepID=A0AAV4TQR9_9ARAC|nr:retrovirus-related Pol polyprotein from type-1 retrotransposable element R2 [Caerostris darwini]
MPFDGVLEHNFILQTSIERARASKRDICIAWLDVTNAFGTLPHSAIFHLLRSNGAGEPLVRLVEDIYTQSATSILTEEGVSPHIPISSGVQQGCPLSGLLFNIAIDPVHLSEVQHFLGWEGLNLHLNPGRSFSYHLYGATPVGILDTEFFLGANWLTPLMEGEFHRFLGNPVGFNPVPDYNSLNDLAELGEIQTYAMAENRRTKVFLLPFIYSFLLGSIHFFILKYAAPSPCFLDESIILSLLMSLQLVFSSLGIGIPLIPLLFVHWASA